LAPASSPTPASAQQESGVAQQESEGTCDYGPPPVIDHTPPEISSPQKPKRLKFDDSPERPGTHPGASSSSSAGPSLPLTDPESSSAGPALPIAQPETTGSDPGKKDESDEASGDETKEFHLSLYSSLTSELLENPSLLRSSCGHDEKVFLEVTKQLDDLEILIQEGLDKWHADQVTESFLNVDHGSSFETSWSKDKAHFVYTGPWKTDVCFYVDLNTLEAFKVDAEVDNLTEEEVYENWDLVDAADRKELEQFVKEKVWKCREASQTKNIIDAIWIRKWKWYHLPGGKKERRVKSRLCARGFLDAQGKSLTTRATTATRLSQRLLVSLSVIFGFDLETWDASGAFLKGFPFKEVESHLRKRGYTAPHREISIRPPANVWRHLREIKGSDICIGDWDSWWYVLECIKAMYGLNDAPLAWQIAQSFYFVNKRNAIQSVFDDCFFFWPRKPGEIMALGTSHVDDNGMGSDKAWLKKEFDAYDKQFGGATRHEMPFTHTGVEYKNTDRGRVMDQNDFCQKLKPFPLAKERVRKILNH
jgi:hypothetical protein